MYNGASYFPPLRGRAVAGRRARGSRRVGRRAAGVVRAVGQVLRVPTGIGTSAHGLPAAGIVGRGRGAGHSVFAGRNWSGHGHHVHLHASQLLDKVVDQEAKDQLDGNLGQNKSLGGLQTDQGQQDGHDHLQLELHQQQDGQEQLVLVLLLSAT